MGSQPTDTLTLAVSAFVFDRHLFRPTYLQESERFTLMIEENDLVIWSTLYPHVRHVFPLCESGSQFMVSLSICNAVPLNVNQYFVIPEGTRGVSRRPDFPVSYYNLRRFRNKTC